MIIPKLILKILMKNQIMNLVLKKQLALMMKKKLIQKKMKKVKFCDLSIDKISKKKKERLKLEFQKILVK